MTANINPDTGIAYGYISANALDPDVVSELQNGTEPHYVEALQRYLEEERIAHAERGGEGDFDEDRATEKFADDWQPDEPIHEGIREGVKYRTSWLGGALNVWIFESPFITDKAGRASPCVPGAGILDTLDGDVRAYDVPPEWRDNE